MDLSPKFERMWKVGIKIELKAASLKKYTKKLGMYTLSDSRGEIIMSEIITRVIPMAGICYVHTGCLALCCIL